MIIGYPMKGWLDVYPGPDDPDFTDAECERLNLIPGVQCYPKALRVSYTAEPILREYLGQWGYSFDRWAPGRTHFSAPLSPPGLYPHQVEGVQTLYGNGGGLLCDEMGLGKALRFDEPVRTPHGWTPIHQLRAGDTVCDPDSGIATVRGVYPQGVQPLYAVRFSDGAEVVATGDHLWAVQTAHDRWTGKPVQVRTTAEILASGLRMSAQKRNGGWRNRRWFVPVPVEPILIESAPGDTWPVPPYVLGVLLGDGYLSGSVSVTKPDEWVFEECARQLPPELAPQRRQGSNWLFPLMIRRIRDLGLEDHLSADKFVPAQYLRASAPMRLALLHGLMDTDGDCTKDGTAVFSTSSPHLRDAVVDLTRSLGGLATVSVRSSPKYSHQGEMRTGQRAYRVNVRLPVNPFQLPRKAGRWRTPNLSRGIDSIEPVEAAEAVCIEVSSARGLFITRDYVITHNTRVAAVAAHKQCEHSRIAQPTLIIGPKFTRDVWRKELEALGYLEDGGANFIALEGRDPTTAKSRLDTVRFRAYAKAQGLGGTWVFIHYDILPEWQGTIYSWGFGACILDEAHFAREGRNKRSKAVAAVMGAVPFRIALTGTPLVNKPAELWHLLTLVCGPGTWGHAMTFRTRYCGAMRDEYGLQDHAPTHVDELRERMTGIYIRRTAASVGAAMVPFSRQTLVADLGAQEEAYYAAEAKLDLSSLVRAVLEGRAGNDVLVQLGKLRKLTAKAKIPTTVAYVQSLLEAGESVVVFTHERATAEAILQKASASWPAGTVGFTVTGELPDAKRAELVEQFQRDGLTVPHVLCATYGALGVGVTLTAARYVVLHDLEWTFASVLQAEKRVHRLSSARGPVTAAWVLAENSVDEIMAQILLMKAEYLAETLGQRDALDAAAELDLKGIAGLADFETRMLAWARGA